MGPGRWAEPFHNAWVYFFIKMVISFFVPSTLTEQRLRNKVSAFSRKHATSTPRRGRDQPRQGILVNVSSAKADAFGDWPRVLRRPRRRRLQLLINDCASGTQAPPMPPRYPGREQHRPRPSFCRLKKPPGREKDSRPVRSAFIP